MEPAPIGRYFFAISWLVCDGKTLIIHPATTTHSRIDAEALVAAGITEDMIRLSVGLEYADDIKADFEIGFRAAKKFSSG